MSENEMGRKKGCVMMSMSMSMTIITKTTTIIMDEHNDVDINDNKLTQIHTFQLKCVVENVNSTQNIHVENELHFHNRWSVFG